MYNHCLLHNIYECFKVRTSNFLNSEKKNLFNSNYLFLKYRILNDWYFLGFIIVQIAFGIIFLIFTAWMLYDQWVIIKEDTTSIFLLKIFLNISD